MTSCEGGRGRSVEFSGATFHFGFSTNEKGALSELEKAQLGTRAIAHTNKQSQNRTQPVPQVQPALSEL